jgi:hypothetical protein
MNCGLIACIKKRSIGLEGRRLGTNGMRIAPGLPIVEFAPRLDFVKCHTGPVLNEKIDRHDMRSLHQMVTNGK